MSPISLLILILIVLLVLGIAIFLYLVLRNRRRVTFSAEPGQVQPDKKEQPPEEFLYYSSSLDLRASFSQALRLLKSYVTGRDYRYRVPWFLMTGESESGKTTILERSGINLSANGSSGDGQLNWYFFNEGVVLDVAGDFVLRADGTANHRGWNTISRLLQRYRPRRPLDGVVLTIPSSDLLGPYVLSNERRVKLEQKATCLYKKLWQSQRILGMRLPVYVLVTKCDEVTGFNSLCGQLPDRLHNQMFGWSNASTLDTAYKPDCVPEVFDSLHKQLSLLQYEIYAECDEIQEVDELFLLPAAIQSMRGPLQVYLDHLFKQSAYHESFFFRGVYFCGETPDELSAAPSAEASIEPNWTQSFEQFAVASSEAREISECQPVFVSDLFKEKIFAEDFLAQPVKRTALSRNRMVLAAQILSVLIILVGGVGLAVAYRRLSTQEQDLVKFLANEERDLRKVGDVRKRTDSRTSLDGTPTNESSSRENISYQVAANRVTPDLPTDAETNSFEGSENNLLTAMADVNGNEFYSPFIPSSWFSSINRRIENAMAGAFKYVIFESLRTDLEQHANSLLGIGPPRSLHCSNGYRSARLSEFIEQLGELRLNLERYDQMVQKGSGSFDELRQLVVYLCHGRIPSDFDEENYLYKRAFMQTEGTPIKTNWIFAGSVESVSAQIENLYEASFNQAGLNYENLSEIDEAEALLRRPEYTWLATSVVNPHSQFQGMTISSALADLKRALQDLKRQRFMSHGDAVTDSRRYQHRVRSVLVWDQESLKQVITLYEQYQTFVETKSYQPWERLDDSAKNVARERVKERISRVLVKASRYEPLPPVTEGSALKASLVEEVRLLQEAQPALSKVLQLTAQLGVDRKLRAALYDQGQHLLWNIHREFVAQRFYISRQNDFSANGQFTADFSWWDGTQPASHLTYDLGGKEELAGYLNIQRKNIAFLARDLFVPVMTFFTAQRIYPAASGQVDWEQLLADLDAYDNKTPGNPIAALENFIRVDMDRTSIESCYREVRIGFKPSGDYFLRIRNSLRAKFYERCTELARVKTINDTIAALDSYRQIENSFNKSDQPLSNNLEGQFPFADVDGPRLEPWALLRFFRLMDEKEKAAREALSRSKDFGADPKNALAFLDQMIKVREFFAPFLEKKQGPFLDFHAQLRVNQDLERGGSQIYWGLEIGKKSFPYPGDDPIGRWFYDYPKGTPIRLVLRWADHSPRRPVEGGPVPVPYTVKDRSAIFEYNDSWSLLTLLLKHGDRLRRAGTAADCDQGLDPNPYTLKFTIRTEPDPSVPQNQPDDLRVQTAEVFMRVSLGTANKPEPLMLPCFPTKAPPVPSLKLGTTDNATNKD